ncbi:hypothetical protein VP01_8598g1 [Puccinia sorghi]|uniref:Uncharacterized protein n=1 Tax=Puccinia sorghi TaxID=27349 RepID=A0A0L6U918_9BASI|nr:hypothetical protein VP01_8598g1 [Puccinia sorghi]
MLTEIAVCKLGVPKNILSFSILPNLNEDIYNVVDHIIMAKPHFSNQSDKATTQLVEVDDVHESKVSLLLVESKNKPIVLDSGDTHHMVNDPACFTPIAETKRLWLIKKEKPLS